MWARPRPRGVRLYVPILTWLPAYDPSVWSWLLLIPIGIVLGRHGR